MEFEAKDLININTMNNVSSKSKEKKIDKLVSEAVGKTIYINNPTLIQKLVEWKKAKKDDEPDNFLDDSAKVEELKKIL